MNNQDTISRHTFLKQESGENRLNTCPVSETPLITSLTPFTDSNPDRLRKSITALQWEKVCETIPHGSKGTLARYGDNRRELGRLILNHWLEDSNGGLMQKPINQAHWRKIKIKGKKTNPNTIQELIDSFCDASLIVRTKKADSKKINDYHLYIGGVNLWQWVDNQKLAEKKADGRYESFLNSFRILGINPDELKKCVCCNKSLPKKHFGKKQNPSCKICYATTPELALRKASEYGKQISHDHIQAKLAQEWVETEAEGDIDALINETLGNDWRFKEK